MPEPIIEPIHSIPEHCDSVRCYVQRVIDACFDVSGMFFDNPIQLWAKWVQYWSMLIMTRLPVLWRIGAMLFIFFILNLLALIYLRVSDVFIYFWNVGKWICGLPLISVFIRFLLRFYRFFVTIPEKAKKEKKEKEKKEKKTNAIHIPSSQLLRELGERLAEKEGEQSASPRGKGLGKEKASGICPICGRAGHSESMCQYKSSEGKKRKKPVREFVRPSPSPSEQPGPSNVRMVSVADQTALHTPVWINGVRFPRCLVDTGSEVNLISRKDVTKYGFSFEMAGIQKISGFNGAISAVDGMMTCDIRLGPSGESKRVEFLVTPATTIPIIGCPTLAELKISLNLQERILQDTQGNVVRCSAARTSKN